MRELFRRILHDHRWFIGFMIVVTLLFLFFWRIISPSNFVATMNAFLKDLWTIAKFFLVIVIMIFGIRIMFGWRPFRQRNQRH